MQLMIHLCLLTLIVVMPSQAGQPDWVTTFGTSASYPQSRYLVGFGVAPGTDVDALKIAEDNARAQVARSILVHIESEFATFTEEDSERFSRYVNSVTQSSTSLHILGLQTEPYVERGGDYPATYVLAHAGRDELRRAYGQKVTELCARINRILQAAQKDEQNSRPMDAVAKYLSLYPLFEQWTEAESIFIVASQSPSRAVEVAFQELEHETGQTVPRAIRPTLGPIEVAQRVDALLAQPMGSLGDVARALVLRLSQQVTAPAGAVLVTPFTYRDTRMGSPFARYLRQVLETHLGRIDWDVAVETRSFQPRTRSIMRDFAVASNATWVLSGSYWDQGGQVRLMASLREVKTGTLLAGADVSFDATVAETLGLRLKPENYQQALIDQQAFREDEIVSGTLQADIWTSKGNQNLLFTEGETMKVYVRVNRPCYVRLLYILADGRYTLLYDGFYLDQSKVNHAVEIPEEFECAPPFGVEMMVLVARTIPFELLETVEEDGYAFLKVSSPQEAAMKTRGFRRKRDKPDDVQQTEVKLVVTTIRS